MLVAQGITAAASSTMRRRHRRELLLLGMDASVMRVPRMAGSAARDRERAADTAVLPALNAVGVEFVDALIAVADDQGVAIRQTQGAVGIVDRDFPIDFAGHVEFLHLADAAEGDEIMAVAQAFDAAPG